MPEQILLFAVRNFDWHTVAEACFRESQSKLKLK